MKYILFLFGLIFIMNASAADGHWSTTLGEGAPSCSLYRKRVANYYHRLNEVELASKAINENLSPKEINRLIELTMRRGVPLSADELAFWTIEVSYEDLDVKMQKSFESVHVTSSLFNWESDKFIFPEDVMKVGFDISRKIMTIELTMPFPFACLGTTNFQFEINWKDDSKYKLNFVLDKKSWDLAHFKKTSP